MAQDCAAHAPLLRLPVAVAPPLCSSHHTSASQATAASLTTIFLARAFGTISSSYARNSAAPAAKEGACSRIWNWLSKAKAGPNLGLCSSLSMKGEWKVLSFHFASKTGFQKRRLDRTLVCVPLCQLRANGRFRHFSLLQKIEFQKQRLDRTLIFVSLCQLRANGRFRHFRLFLKTAGKSKGWTEPWSLLRFVN